MESSAYIICAESENLIAKGVIMRTTYLESILTEEDRMIQQLVRDFVEKEIMPVRQQIDDDEEHVIVRGLLQGLTSLGLQRAIISPKYGGMGVSRVVPFCLIYEELARGDSGIAIAAGCTSWCWQPAVVAGNEAILQRYAPQFCGEELQMGCFAITEPEGGCDIENPDVHGRTISTTAKLDGDEWVINGAKRFPSNAGVSQLYCVVCTTDPSLGDEGIALIYVPSPTEGLSFGKFENKAGMQGDRNCDIYFDNVRVPKEHRAAGPGMDAALFKVALTGGRTGTAAYAVGNAQAAFEKVLDFTKNRVVAGKPIREHSICAGILADIAIGIETARAYFINVAYMCDHPETYGLPNSDFMLSRASIAKVYACDMAVMVTNRAMELMGSYGYMKEYDVEKYWRDCKVLQLVEGGAQLGRLDIMRDYYI